jgi:hypothetical protein
MALEPHFVEDAKPSGWRTVDGEHVDDVLVQGCAGRGPVRGLPPGDRRAPGGER